MSRLALDRQSPTAHYPNPPKSPQNGNYRTPPIPENLSSASTSKREKMTQEMERIQQNWENWKKQTHKFVEKWEKRRAGVQNRGIFGGMS